LARTSHGRAVQPVRHHSLGEGVVGTAAALSAVIDREGWTLDAVLIGIAGIGLTFGMWWVYFLPPSADVLQRHRDRAPVWATFRCSS